MSDTDICVFCISVAEHSHRSALATNIVNQAKADLATCLDIPDDYDILFMQGGGTVCGKIYDFRISNPDSESRANSPLRSITLSAPGLPISRRKSLGMLKATPPTTLS